MTDEQFERDLRNALLEASNLSDTSLRARVAAIPDRYPVTGARTWRPTRRSLFAAIGGISVVAIAVAVVLMTDTPRPAVGQVASAPSSSVVSAAAPSSLAAPATPGAAASTAASPTPAPPMEFARIVAEGVQLRTKPGGGEVIVSTTGDLGLLVPILARTTVDGVQWVNVEHWSPRGTARFGWLPAVADVQTPYGVKRVETLEPARLPCDFLASTDLASVTRHPPAVRLACLGAGTVKFGPVIARTEGADALATGEPAWLAAPSGLRLYGQRGWDSDDVALDVQIEPGSGLTLPEGTWLNVVGRFDDPTAASCTRNAGRAEAGVGEPAQQVLWCRQQFVLTDFSIAEPPAPEPEPTPLPRLGGSWQAITPAPIQGRGGHTATWTGKEMIIWGGLPGPTTVDDTRVTDGTQGAAYDPATDRWRVIVQSPLAPRQGHLGAWTGSEALFWGGWSFKGERLADGAAFDPRTNSWRALAPSPLRGTGGAVGTWTGERWLVVDGITDAGGPITVEVAAYDPATDSWSSLPSSELPASWSVSAAWTGQELLLVANPNQGLSAGFRFRPGENAWSAIAAPPFAGLSTGAGVWTGSELLVPSITKLPGEAREQGLVFAYDPESDRWRTASPPLGGLSSFEPVWTGRYAVFFAGRAPAAAYDPVGDRWFAVAPAEPPLREFASGIWADDRFIAWGGSEGESFLRPADGAVFLPGWPLE